MGLFDFKPTTEPIPVKESKYTVAKVQERLTTLGLQRLLIKDARLKVIISMIAWNAVPYLSRIGGETPSGAQVSDMMSTLDMLNEALGGYIKIQNDPAAYASQPGGPEVLMKSAYDAASKYLLQLLSTSATSGDASGFRALTEYLNSLNSPTTPGLHNS